MHNQLYRIGINGIKQISIILPLLLIISCNDVIEFEAKNYEPSYAHGSMIKSGSGGAPWKMSDALATAMTAGVAAAAPVSQSSSSGGFSSGSSGGGSSGGGGGGGGGGGW